MVLIIALVVGSLLNKKPSTVSAVAPGTRAVVVPTADAARTVVVPPCATGAPTATNASTAINTPGSVVVQFAKGEGTRLVLVPKCTAVHPGVTATNYFPSAAFVPGPGTNPPPIGTGKSVSVSSSSSAGAPQSAQFQVSVPAGSPIRTIVVQPCQRLKGSGPAETILGTTSGSTTAVAPAC